MFYGRRGEKCTRRRNVFDPLSRLRINFQVAVYATRVFLEVIFFVGRLEGGRGGVER